MAVELRVPAVGESITEVEVGDWLQPAGEMIRQDDAVVMIETEKVTVELPAPVSGVVTQMLKKKGEHASVGEVIGYMEARDGARAGEGQREPAPAAARAPTRQEAPRVMPAARRVLEEKGLAAEKVAPTGPGGRITKEDALAAAAAPAPAQPRRPPAAPGAREEEVVAMTPIRRRIAERLVQAQQRGALLTTFNEVDMTEVMALRRSYREAFQEKYGVKLGFMSFFVKGSVEALKAFPAVNAEVRGDSIVYKNYYDIGVAVGGGKGLVVPVLRNAERLSFAEIESAIGDFAARAQKGTLKLEELEGGTFTISNGGVYGSMLSTPIVNPPQSGILGLHAIEERAVVKAGQVVPRPMMYVALTYDHRIVDGREAVQFLRRIKEVIETPARILLEL